MCVYVHVSITSYMKISLTSLSKGQSKTPRIFHLKLFDDTLLSTLNYFCSCLYKTFLRYVDLLPKGEGHRCGSLLTALAIKLNRFTENAKKDVRGEPKSLIFCITCTSTPNQRGEIVNLICGVLKHYLLLASGILYVPWFLPD